MGKEELVARGSDLARRIAALKAVGIDVAEDEAQLAEVNRGLAELEKEAMLSPVKEAVRMPSTPDIVGGDTVPLDIEVDVSAFESGGQALSAPLEPGLYRGCFVDVITPKTKGDQRWFIFRTDDPQLERQVRSALVTTPGGAGAFKLKDILEALGVEYQLAGKRLIANLTRGIPCQLEYQEVVLEGKTQNRLQNIYAASDKLEQAF